MLLRHFKTAYPVTPEIQGRFFRDTPRDELARLYIETFEAPLSRNGLNLKALRQGSFFTREGKRRVPGSGPSYGTARDAKGSFTRRLRSSVGPSPSRFSPRCRALKRCG